MIVNILSPMGSYPVELGDKLTVHDLPAMIQGNGGIVVPFQEDGKPPSNLFLPASQIQGITWVIEAMQPAQDLAADVADVSYIGEEEPVVGNNGEVFIDS